MALKVIIAGLGGQGVVFVTRLLARTAVALGYPVMASETHGMSQRGGSVISHLKVGGIDAPLIQRGTADVLLALAPDEAVRNLPFLRRGGTAFVNADDGLPPEVAPHLARLELEVLTVPATRLASELDAPAVANVVLVGFALGNPALPLPYETLREIVATTVRRNREANLRALEAGHLAGGAVLHPSADASATIG